MTREEAIKEWIIPALKNTWNEKKNAEILKALEQESCEDAISRAEVLDLIDSKDPNYEVRHFKEDVECLPPISSHESKTVLYSGDGYADGYMVYDMAECPNCGYEYEDGDKDWGLPFCPNCGQSLNWESEEV